MNPIPRLNQLAEQRWQPARNVKVDLHRLRDKSYVASITPVLQIDEEMDAAIDAVIERVGEHRGRGWLAWFRGERLNAAAGAVLLAYSAKVSELAVRKGDPELLIRGIKALAAGGGANDVRDSLVVLAQLFHSAQRLDFAVTPILEEVAGCCTDKEMEAAMRGFPARPIESRELQAFRLREADGPEGFFYESVE
jgi:hypothetical protein